MQVSQLIMLLAAAAAVAGPAASPKPGQPFVVDLGNGVSLEMVWIPPGTFMMGSTPEERAWALSSEGMGSPKYLAKEGEQPRSARIRNGFWLGKTEVTLAQWKQFNADSGYRTEGEVRGTALCPDWQGDKKWKWMKYAWYDPNFEQDDRHPVVCVSWNDAAEFCDWLTGREKAAGRLPENMVYRLPTEAEWEYACRGGRSGTKFWWGDRLSDGQGRLNLAGTDKWPNGGVGRFHVAWDDGYAFTAPVGAYGAKGTNGFGLSDMSGNVWEWCLDGYTEKGAQEEPYYGDTSIMRVARGGSFSSEPFRLRCVSRAGGLPALSCSDFGFRLCLGVPR